MVHESGGTRALYTRYPASEQQRLLAHESGGANGFKQQHLSPFSADRRILPRSPLEGTLATEDPLS
jgi:hypothetical protein